VITCAEAVRQLWEYLDGAVDEQQRRAIEEHLSFCRRCCGELEFAEEMRAFLATHAAEELPDDVRARLVGTLDELRTQREP
jgi:mycothiol system anti-sigma-R factor